MRRAKSYPLHCAWTLLLLATLACGGSEDEAKPGEPGSGVPAASENSSAAPATGSDSESAGASEGVATSEGAAADDAQPSLPPQQEIVKLDLNTADDEALRVLPGSDARTVRELAKHRPYSSVRQLRQALGGDATQSAELERYVFVPIDYNQSDAETLQQLPTIDASRAARLIAERPFASEQAFLDRLAYFLEESQLDVAKSYLAH